MEPDFDMEGAAADIASDLGLGGSEEPQDDLSLDDTPAEAPVEAETPLAVDPYAEPPKSWKKEWHEKWSTVDPSVREIFYTREKQMLDGLEQYKANNDFGAKLKPVFDQYKPYLEQHGIDEVKAVQYLLSAQYRLQNGTPQEKMELFQRLAQDYGIPFAQQQAAQAEQAQQAQLPPEITQALQKVNALESVLIRQQQAQAQQVREKVSQEVSAFASDPANEHFDEVANEVIQFINLGMPLKDAYEKAVWTNPVTRQKQLEKAQTEHFEKQKAKAKEEAEAALKAKSANVRNRATKAPTEPLGSWDDTMQATLAAIKAGAH